MTPFDGFCGPSYQLENRYAAIERTVNWLTVANESADEKKFRIALEPTPGNAKFGALPVPAPFNQPNRGLIELRGQAFGVNGDTVFQIDETGTYTQIGTVVNDHKPVSMVANGNRQIFIASAGIGNVIGPGGTWTPAVSIASYATFQDGYIAAIQPDSHTLQISGNDTTPVGDATLWSAANVSVQAGQADLLRAVISSREYLRLLGARRSQIYYNVGNNGIGGFPFQSYNETFIETGIAAAFSLADLGDSLIWMGEDARGMRACWRDQAFQPQRISTFAVELAWAKYARVDDAVAFAYIWNGHMLYQITFPSATVNQATGQAQGATWVYDATVSQLIGRPVWTERAYQSAFGFSTCRPEQFHCFAFGRHLVGSAGQDGNPGAIYQYSSTAYTDCGTDAGAQVQQPIVRDRIAPHLWNNNNRIKYERIRFETSRGQGLDGDPNAPGANPSLALRWSNDGGNTYGAEYSGETLSLGRIGEYSKLVYLNRLGYARDRVFWTRYSDPAYCSLIGAELDFTELGS